MNSNDNSLYVLLQQAGYAQIDNSEYVVHELLQELSLFTLSKTDFFSNVAFNGGTALRIFHNLDRFSEDLDFSLIDKNVNCDLTYYGNKIKSGLEAFGIKAQIEEKKDKLTTGIEVAYLKFNKREIYDLCFKDNDKTNKLHRDELIKIKIEVDTKPADYASFENLYKFKPLPYEVCLYDKPTLFAGKIHAVLCRSWGERFKGRDLYDYWYYIANKTELNLPYLSEKLRNSGHIGQDDECSIEDIKDMLCERFKQINYEDAKKDVASFLTNNYPLDIWSPNFFIAMTQEIEGMEPSLGR